MLKSLPAGKAFSFIHHHKKIKAVFFEEELSNTVPTLYTILRVGGFGKEKETAYAVSFSVIRKPQKDKSRIF